MSRTRHESRQQRQSRFEQFEQRLVMSAQAVGSLLPVLDIASPALTQQVVTHPLLNNVSATTQAADVGKQYGFDGAGQTVAVIDSGIAWDHYALGGGFGAGHKVVGGWDFAENDANPYDDGPAGFHGTHVSGIIGSTDAQYRGVASGADLVALRVFDDQGAGDLKWVEQALQWVHDHRNDFANPITTVNLSLGTDWNGFNTPEWATLEDEFAQLEADGLFISVAAGNSFTSYNRAGLSYPAVSSHVVPVASHDAAGKVSDFSQRAENALVAPGESIKSTVPKHFFGSSVSDRFVGSTGTSMAAPYVAGASAILRQANEFMGTTGINQDMLYQQFRETADKIYDSVTKGYYYKINLEAAIASVVTDLNDNTAATATQISSPQEGTKLTGTIGKANDIDYFSFKASTTGVMRMRFDATLNLKPVVDVVGSTAQFNGNEVTFSVEAGKRYSFSVASSDGTGHYTINTKFEAGVPATNWGKIDSQTFTGQTIKGEAMYRVQAGQDGFLTVKTSAGQSSALTLELYDSQMNRVATRAGDSSNLRLDVVAKQGETYFLKATGSATNVNFRLENSVSLKSGTLSIMGTNQNDSITVDATNGFNINLNGIGYNFKQSEVAAINIDGKAGQDTIDVKLGSQNDTVLTKSTGLHVSNSQFKLNANGIENVSIDAGTGFDTIAMQGSAGNDNLVMSADRTTLVGSGFTSRSTGFDVVYAKSSGGFDTAQMTGTAGKDTLVSRDGRHTLFAGGNVLIADQFASITVDGSGGTDRANVYGTAGHDKFVLRPTSVQVTNQSETLVATSFETINAISGRGADWMTMYDSAGDDVFHLNNGVGVMSGSGYVNVALNFDVMSVIASTGNDMGQLFDTAGNDIFTSTGAKTVLQSASSYVATIGFDRVNAVAQNGGFDTAIFLGDDGSDRLRADVNSVTLVDANQLIRRAVGFEKAEVDLGKGFNSTVLNGSEKIEKLRARYSNIEFETTLQMLQLKNSNSTSFEGNGGADEVSFNDFGELDLLQSLGDKATAYFKDHVVTATKFAILEAQSVDNAIADYDLEAVDYLYMLRGKWKKL